MNACCVARQPGESGHGGDYRKSQPDVPTNGHDMLLMRHEIPLPGAPGGVRWEVRPYRLVSPSPMNVT